MHTETFLREFAPLASGPGGVQKLRELVLQLAVRGSFSETGVRENTSQVALAEIIADIRSGNTPSKRQPEFWGGTIPWASVKDLKVGSHVLNETQDQITEKAVDQGGAKTAKAGEILICTRMGLGKIALLEMDCAFNQDLKAVRLSDSVDPIFFIRAFQTIEVVGTGTTVSGISQKTLLNYRIPLPPLAEQKRIVDKVDELMALCDELEAQQAKETGLKRASAASALHHLTESKTREETANRLSLLATHFDELFDDLESIKALRAALVRSLCSGAFSNDFVVSVEDDDAEYPIPKSWDWVKLGSLLENVTSGSRGWNQYFAPDGERFIRSQDIKFDRIEFDEPVFVALPGTVEGTRTSVRLGDLLLTITGANTGKCAIVHDLDRTSYVSQHVALLRPNNIENTRYLHIWLTGEWAGREILLRDSYGIRSGLNLKQIRDLPVPLPPLAEQKHISARFDELMALCDQLENQVREGERLNTELMASLVHSLTETDPYGGGAVEPEGSSEDATEITAPEPAGREVLEKPDIKGVMTSSKPESEAQADADQGPSVNTKFQEAVLVAAIVNTFFKAGGEPIGNFRLQKAVYFARRKMGEHVDEMAYLKKAAGPYNPSMKYSGGIAIAKQKNWLREARGRFGFGHVPGRNADDAGEWIDSYGYGSPTRWVAEHLRFKKNVEWEALATIDYAIEHLQTLGIEPDAGQILQYIASDPEWRPKIEKLGLTEISVGTSMLEVQALFGPKSGDGSA